MSEQFQIAQGYAKPATAEDLVRDAEGITNPNLHRRIDPELGIATEDYLLATTDNYYLATTDGEVLVIPVQITDGEGTTYTLFVSGVNSYRATSYNIQDENSEIP